MGYARAQFDDPATTPAGVAIFGFRQNNVLITEAAVPATPRMQSGRIYAEVSPPINTGIAFANPNDISATVSFRFNGPTGAELKSGSFVMSPNSQFAAFMHEAPFLAPAPLMASTMTFESSVPLSVIALRSNVNSRSDPLLTTLPVSPLTTATASFLLFPHFVDGGGWVTETILINTTNQEISGTFSIVGQPGEILRIRVEDQLATSFAYNIPRQSARRFRTTGTTQIPTVGSLRVFPATGSPAPSGLLVLSFKRDDRTVVSETGVSLVNPATAVRLYAEATGTPESKGSIQTGLAVANPSTSSVQVTIELLDLNGTSLPQRHVVTLPSGGQDAFFLTQLSGLASMPDPFQGIVRVSTNAPSGVAVTGLRGRLNERGEFLAVTTPPVPENAGPASEIIFPHFAEGGGYTTQFVLFSPRSSQQPSGLLRLLSQSGSLLGVTLRTSRPGGE